MSNTQASQNTSDSYGSQPFPEISFSELKKLEAEELLKLSHVPQQNRIEINALAADLLAERKDFLISISDPHPDAKTVAETWDSSKGTMISMETLNDVLSWGIKWGKYRGLTYRQLYVQDPGYFHTTLLRKLAAMPYSLTYCALSLLRDNSLAVLKNPLRPVQKRYKKKTPAPSSSPDAREEAPTQSPEMTEAGSPPPLKKRRKRKAPTPDSV